MSDPRVNLPEGVNFQDSFIATPYTSLGVGSGMGTQALMGQRFRIFENHGEFAKGALLSILPTSDRIDYIGHIRVRDLSGEAWKPTHIVSAVSAPVFVQADIKSTIFRFLPRNAMVLGTYSGDFLDLGGVGFVHKNHIIEREQRSERAYMDIAMDMMGMPYVWGGTGGGGVDCSGLVQSALAMIGQDVPRDTDQQETAIGRAVDYDNREAGDILFWPGHVGIVTDGDKLLHANAFHMCVAVEPITQAVARIGEVSATKRLSL